MRKHGLKRFGTCMFKKDGALSLTNDLGLDGDHETGRHLEVTLSED